MNLARVLRGASITLILCAGTFSDPRELSAVTFSEFLDPNPAPGNQFGHTVVPLSTGNVVITSPFDDAGGTDAGAVYLFDGSTGALISTLRGSTANDQIGFQGIDGLLSGNFLIRSPLWNNGAVVDAGAVTWGSGTTGVSGVISAANSLVGSTASDQVGSNGVTALTNGNYLVRSRFWDNGASWDVGAVTWGSGSTGVKGVISAANSLIGGKTDDRVGFSPVRPLSNGNYVVTNWFWDNGALVDVGAATWGNGSTGTSGVMSAANSLVGSRAGDGIDINPAALTNGNYVIFFPWWDNGAVVDAGAVTWCSGTSVTSAVVSAANSLVGTTAYDYVGNDTVTPLTNGNYVVGSWKWHGQVGAATWGNGTSGVTGPVSADNSLVGSSAGDGTRGIIVTPLSNGNYVVRFRDWNSRAGAVTWGSGTTGVAGPISAANSLVGTMADEVVGANGVFPLTDGNYVVASAGWDNGAAVNAGAATWCSGTSGLTGVISAANSLVGSSVGNGVGSGVTVLTNGNYVVASPGWDNGSIADVGAATWCSGTSGLTGVISDANSLVGIRQGDGVGNVVTPLTNGNYIVRSGFEQGAATAVGAITWGNGTTGATGVVSAANSLVGSTAYDFVGYPGVTALTNGSYVVASSGWDNGAAASAGAATWGDGTTGVTGVVSAANSLVGTTTDDRVSSSMSGGNWVTALSNGNYVVVSPAWDNGAIPDAGAVTLGSGTAGMTGDVVAANSIVGTTANTNLQPIVLDNVNHTFIARFLAEGGGRVRVGSQDLPNVGVADNPETARPTIGVHPNPARGSALHVAFALPTGGAARLELLDVSGRRVVARDVGSFGAGQHVLNLAEGRKVAPGIYWVRLTQNRTRQQARVAVIE